MSLTNAAGIPLPVVPCRLVRQDGEFARLWVSTAEPAQRIGPQLSEKRYPPFTRRYDSTLGGTP